MVRIVALILFLLFFFSLLAGGVVAFVSGEKEMSYAIFFIAALIFVAVIITVAWAKWIARLPAHSTKAVIMAKNIVKKLEPAGDSLDTVTYYQLTFETESHLQWTFNVSPKIFNTYLEGDYGTLVYKQSKRKTVYYQSFVREKQNDRSFFENKLALAQNMEQLYFTNGPNAVVHGGAVGYNAVVNYYANAERVGGGIEPVYWISLARFYVKGNIYGFQNGSLLLRDRQKLMNNYSLYMDNAIKFTKDEKQKAAFMEEKQKTLAWLYFELQKYPERNQFGCYIATATYGSYDCPQVFVLRRFRDDRLAKSRLGRAFIKTYYFISPGLVRIFGNSKACKAMSRLLLDQLLLRLQASGISNAPYRDEP